MAHPFEIKESVIKLRRKGYSLGQLSRRFHISKTTLSDWCSSVILDAKAKKKLLRTTREAQLVNAEKRRTKTKTLEEEYFQEALSEIQSDKNQDKIMCAMLYWCEGSKSPHGVAFANSDPKLAKSFLSLLRRSFVLDEAKFRPCIHLHDYHSPEKQLDFWSKITDIDK